jgi:hypothetical protein
MGRGIQNVAALAPGLSTNTPNGGQVTIAGNFAYDNVFLLDGVDIDDNLFGSPNTVYIEEAIEETQVLTSGISAEYGRFGGGVINAVTKHGGNAFSGSFRTNLTNPSWRDETPIEVSKGITRQSHLNKSFEATLGGPFVKDKLWFFAAGRSEKSNTQQTLPETADQFTATRDQTRGELKLTGAINPNHTVSATYTRQDTKDHRETFGFSIDPVTTVIDTKTPNDLFVMNYNGALRSNLFAEVQFSQKKFRFEDFGGTSKDILQSPFIAQSVLAHYNAPYFDATDPEDRNNRQLAASLSYFLSTRDLGKHDIKVGFENFRSTRTGGNSQSSTDWVFYTDYLTDDSGKPVRDSGGHIIPLFIPGVSILQNWQAVRGAEVNLTTNSAYANDRWTLNNHWSFNLGVRAEWATGDATGGIKPVDASRIVPRLSAAYDFMGNGQYRLEGTYSHYAGKYSESQFANNTNVGNPDSIYYIYTGPAGQGVGFAPGFVPANYGVIATGTFPTANVFYDKDIKSPVTKEWTAAFGTQLGHNGFFKAIYTSRKVNDFVQVFVTQATGSTDVKKGTQDFGTFSNRLWANSNDGLREYQGLQFQFGYRVNSHWRVDGHYTLQIKNDGNQEGEGQNTPGAPSLFPGYYPEIFNEARGYPIGHLNPYEQHRVRAWTTYNVGLGKAGSLDASVLYAFDSGQAFSLASSGVPLTSIQKAIGSALYPDLPGTQTVFYSAGRGSENYQDAHIFNVALNYAVPIYRSAKPWVKLEVRNVFDSTPLISFNTTVRPDPSSPKDALGLPTGFVKGTSFGKGTSTGNYATPREYFVSFGFRF